ncbi:MAG: hypothetical protein L0211_11520, partial [Planctomycetaceae bacterium]|nr:hypothetical protein [Planctomycetaceae bacterium]
NFQNTGGVVLGNAAGDTTTFTGGITSTAGPTTIQGAVITSATNITLGSTTLVSTVTLLTSGGHVTIGPISGAGVPLTINAGTGDVTLADPANVIGNLTITADALTLFENDNITQGGAWTTTGPTTLNSGAFAIVLTNPANQLGPLNLTGGNITVVEAGDTELTAVAWIGLLAIDATGNLLISGLVTGNGTAQLSADGNVVFATGGSLVATGGSANVAIQAGGVITLPDGVLINAGAGTIALTASGHITLGRLVTTNSTAAAVAITSLAGSVIDGGDSGGANIVAEGLGAVVSISAAQGVGSAASPLDLAVRNLVVTSGGDQYLNELNDLSSLNLNAGSANIYLAAGGQIQDADGAVDLHATDLAIVAAGAGTNSAGTSANPLHAAIDQLEAAVGTGGLFLSDTGGLTIGGVRADLEGVESSGGNIKVFTSGSILVSEAVQADIAGTVELLTTGDITLEALVSSGSGNVTLSATRDIFASPSGGLATAAGTMLLLADSDNSGGGTIQFAGDIDVGAGQVIFSLSDADGQLSGSIQGSGGLVKQASSTLTPGTLTLTATSINTYTGTTQLLAGTMRVDGAIGAGGPAGTFFLAGGTTLTGGGDVNAPIFASSSSAKIVSLGNLKLGDGTTSGFDFAGTLLVAGGDNVTLRDADLAELGVLTMISAGGHLTALGGVEVGSGEKLAGSGAVSGNIVVLAGGVVTPGASPGVVSTLAGNVTLLGGAIYVVEVNGLLPGTGYDQINVQGAVDVSGAVLSLAGGSSRPPTGTIFTLIENDGSDEITGQFQGLAEGATVRFGGIEATISYKGGTGNDVTLTVTDFRIIRTIPPEAGARVDDEGGGGTSFTQRTTAPPLIVVESARPATISQGTDIRPQSLESRSVERLRVFLKVVDEVTGQEEGKDVNLHPRVLDDVLGFFQRYRFPNGRYRIYVQEGDKSPRLIIEIDIRDGRAVSPEQKAPGRQDAPANEQPANQQPAPPLPAPPAPAQPAPPAADPAADGAAIDMSPGDQASDIATASPSHTHRWSTVAAPLAASLALASAAPNWRRRINRLLAASDRLPRTRFHRRLPKLPAGNSQPPTY